MEFNVETMCRCCASEGECKDVKTSFQWMDSEKIYADLLKECFDVQLSSSSTGQYGGICEVCITQLRNAANFKKQMLHTEEQFKAKYEIKSDVPDGKPKKRAARATTSQAKKACTDEPDTSVKQTQAAQKKSNVKKPQTKVAKPKAIPKPRKPTFAQHMRSIKNYRFIVDEDVEWNGPDDIKYNCGFCGYTTDCAELIDDHLYNIHPDDALERIGDFSHYED